MASQTFNQYARVHSKGGFLRVLWAASINASSGNLTVLPHSVAHHSFDPRHEDMMESDSNGPLFLPTVAMNTIQVNLSRRYDPVSLDALGIRAINFAHAVALDIGNSGLCDWWVHMSIGPYERAQDQKSYVGEGFSLMGGQLMGRNVAIPAWAKATEGQSGIPNINGYTRSGVSFPSISGAFGATP